MKNRWLRIDCTRCPFNSRSIKRTAEHLRDTNHNEAEVMAGNRSLFGLTRFR